MDAMILDVEELAEIRSILGVIPRDDSTAAYISQLVDRRPHVQPGSLVVLAAGEDEMGRRVAASHPATPPDALAGLVKGANAEIFFALANNPATPEPTLRGMARIPALAPVVAYKGCPPERCVFLR